VKPDASPVTSRRDLAKLLRLLRHERRYALEYVAAETQISPGFLSRVERGQRGLGDANAQRLCDFYQVPPSVRATVRQLASSGREAAWWDEDKKNIPRAIREYIGVEQVATSITSYGSIIPGLFQTRAYAEAATGSMQFEADTSAQSTAVDHRLKRQLVLDRDDPPWVHAILDEATLHRAISDIAVWRDQLRALLRAAGRPRVTLQFIPFRAGAHPGVDSRFVVVSTSEDHTPQLVHVEGLSGFRNFDRAHDLGHYARAFRALSAIALTPSESRRLLRAAIERLDPPPGAHFTP
jgi:transcriptional regulator with XRE-family HTH domain